ncbi:MAG: Hsp70 family protein [Planctomycetes bacterium]|nr:Hsp70 family protein [Planctomycetota bacterium]
MTPPNEQAVGIDLGTTYSAVAHLDPSGRPVTLVNAEGDLITPSVVLFEGTSVIVGKEARKAIATDANQVADCAKRDLGSRVYHKLLEGRQYPPEAVAGFILNKLRLDAERQIGQFKKVVITVPAYFDEVRRKSTQDAGYMAGFEVLDIINEPTAAAVAYGFQKGFLDETGSAREAQNVLVYDLGGGTFDVTVMRLEGSDFRTLATDGDVQLGGRDWDTRLIDFVAEDFIRRHSLDPREDPNAAGRLWRECEDAKRTLSARQRANIACDYKGQAARVEITREKFQEITHDLLDRTRFTVRQTLLAAGLEWDDIDRVLLVGGSTRMPMVSDMLRELSGKIADNSVAADEAVAHGAALQAGLALARAAGRKGRFHIENVNSHSLGVVATDPQTQRKRNACVIPRNTPLPVNAKRQFKTQKQNQKTILVQIVEGESKMPDECLQIGKCVVRDLPPDLPPGTPIDVRFRYEENGRLTIVVTVGNNGTELRHEITRDNTLTQGQLDRWRKYIAGTAVS